MDLLAWHLDQWPWLPVVALGAMVGAMGYARRVRPARRYAVIAAVAAHPGTTAFEVAQRFEITTATAYRWVSEAHRCGLLERTRIPMPGPHDRFEYRVTDAGHELVGPAPVE